MDSKITSKIKAVELRQRGHSYSEIAKVLHVSKSSLSLWLRNTELNEDATLSLKAKLKNAQKLGAEARQNQKLAKVAQITRDAVSEIPDISNEDLFLMGIMLYWGEGSKQKSGDPTQRVEFSNSDPLMCKLFIKWLRECLKVDNEDIVPCIYIHESKVNFNHDALSYWSKQINISTAKFGNTCFTKTVYPRKNQRRSVIPYYGQLRVRVKKSTDLNRKIAGWTKGVCIRSGVAIQNTV